MAQAGFIRRGCHEPTLLKLKTMKGADGNPLRIISRIAAGDYMTFGMCLLQDENGDQVYVLKKTHARDGPVGITAAIIKQWLTSGAAPTRTYQHLTECLRQSELGALAEDIAITTASEDISTASPILILSGETNQTMTCLTSTQESREQILSSANFKTRQGFISTEKFASQKKELTTITQHTDHHITSYASYLRDVYRFMSQGHTSQHWTHLPQCEFVKLAIIKGEKVRHGGPEEEMIRLAQQGKIETIMNRKQQVNLENLFSSPPQPPPPAPPPSPSTEHPMSYQLNEHSQPNIDISMLPTLKQRVVLIEGAPGGGKSTLALYICHKWAQGAWFLSKFDIVVLAYLRDEAIQKASTLADILLAKKYSQSVSDVATQIINCNGVRVLFIFDGWDEFPTKLQKKSLISTIIQEPHELDLQQSTVIVTTRPVASGNLLHIADQRVEILGFTQHQINEYIEKALDGDNTRIQKLVQHLKDHPVIEGYCYIPLHVATLVHIFLTMKGVLPTTLHELFCNLVLCCIIRELETHESDKTLDTEFSSLDDLPDDLKSQLSDLRLLAYEGVMQDKVIFYKIDLKALHLPTNLPSLGLLQAVEGLTLTSKSHSYNFLHLSVQELLAAYHISQMNPSTQVEVFKKLFGSSRFEAVLHYYCGFTKLENPEIQDFLSTYSCQQTSFNDILPLLHCFFEAQQPRLAQLIDHKLTDVIDLEFLSDNPVDYIAVGYFISSLLSMSASNSIQLKIGDNVDDYRLKLLLSQLSRRSIERRLQVDMHKPSITGKGVQLLTSHLKQSPSVISELSIAGFHIQRYEDDLLHIAEALQTNCHLTKLKLHYMNLNCSRENGSVLAKLLCMNKTLTHLDLSENTIFSYSGSHYILESLQQNTTLVHLNLANTGLSATEDTTRALTTMLQVNTSLTHLILSRNFIGNHSIFKSLQHNTTLVHLDLSRTGMEIDMDIESTFQALIEMLKINKTLAYLNLSNNGISDSQACSIFQALQHNTGLVHLNLLGAIYCISDEVAVCIAEALEFNCSLQILNVRSNRIEIIGFNRIAKSLESNSTLRELHLVYNSSETIVKKMVQAINRIRQEKGLHPLYIGM